MIVLFSTDFDFDLIVPPTPVIKAPPATEGPEGLGTPGISWWRYHRPKNVIFTPISRPGL